MFKTCHVSIAAPSPIVRDGKREGPMMNRRFRAVLLSVAVLALMASAASAQLVENAMRGGTVVAAPTASAAWIMNPAMLGSAAAAPADPFQASGMKHAVSADFEVSGDTSLFSVNWAGAQAGSDLGFGAGYTSADDAHLYGVGVGKAFDSFSAGLAWAHFGPAHGYRSENMFHLGVGGSVPMGPSMAQPASWGLVVRDLSGQMRRHLDLGVALPLDGGILVAMDVRDITDEIDRTFHIGGSMQFGKAEEFEVGVGLNDGDLTLGALYDLSRAGMSSNWKAGVAWVAGDRHRSDTVLIGVSGTLGF